MLGASIYAEPSTKRTKPTTIVIWFLCAAAVFAALYTLTLRFLFATALVTVVVVSVSTLMVLQHRKFEFGMLGWIAALLFALPAVRNVMPGVPAVGTFSDFLVLFWALGLLVATMIWMAIVWVRHPIHQQ